MCLHLRSGHPAQGSYVCKCTGTPPSYYYICALMVLRTGCEVAAGVGVSAVNGGMSTLVAIHTAGAFEGGGDSEVHRWSRSTGICG